MNEKKNIQELVDNLSESHGLSKRNADSFVKEFFELIEEALERDKYVRIKGLGTFKLINVDSRESINVNTGERFEIQEHTKISFTPEPALKETINKPFSHFETVILNEGTVLDDTLEEEGNGMDEEMIVEPIAEAEPEIPCETKLEVPAIEEPAIEEPAAEMPAEESPIVEEPVAEEPVVEEPVVENPVGVEPVMAEPVVEESVVEESVPEEPVVEEPIESESTAPASPKEETVSQPEPETSSPLLTREPIVREPVFDEEALNPTPQKKRWESEEFQEGDSSGMKYFIGIVSMVVILCVAALAFIYFPSLYDLFLPKKTEPVAEPPLPVLVQDTVRQEVKEEMPAEKADTLVDSLQVVVTEPIVEEPKREELPKQEATKQEVPAAAPIIPDSSSYTIVGTETTYTIKQGETLTRVALRFWGTKKLWPYLVKHNPKVITNPNHVPYGTTIRIPKLEKSKK